MLNLMRYAENLVKNLREALDTAVKVGLSLELQNELRKQLGEAEALRIDLAQDKE